MPADGAAHAWTTICSSNYIAYVRVLFETLKRSDPIAADNFFLILADDPLPRQLEDSLPFPVINAADLGLAEIWDMAIRYSIVEFNTAIKPSALRYLFDQGFDRVTYLDPDMAVFKRMSQIGDLHDAGHDLILTPHSTSPLIDGKDPDDIRLMRTGAYNLGFISVQDSRDTRALLDWWQTQLLKNCRVDLDNGLFVDQKFMDLAPSYCSHTHILRHSGYNVAYWNLASRKVEQVDGVWKAGGEDLYCFHFSGVVADNPNILSVHQNRFTADNIGDLRIMLLQYLNKLNGYRGDAFADIPYAFGRFSDSSDVPDIYRKVFAAENKPTIRARNDAFAANLALLDTPDSNFDQSEYPFTKVMSAIWKIRPDLRDAFNLSDRRGQEAFCRWFISAAEREYQLPQCAYASVRAALEFSDVETAASARSMLARKIMRVSVGEKSLARKTFRALPHVARVRIRDFVIRAASGHSPYGARVATSTRKNGSLTPGFALFGYMSAMSGVGEGVRRMTSILGSAGLAASHHMIDAHGHPSEQTDLDAGSASEPSPYNCALFHINADQTPNILNSLPASAIRGRYRIGYWAWELPSLPDAYVEALDYVDEVWVPSNYVRRAVQEKTNKPVHVVPHAVPRKPDSREIRINFGLPASNFLVLCALDLKSHIARKNPLAAYEAFCKAFPEPYSKEGPRLVLKVISGPDQLTTSRDLFAKVRNDKRVIFIDMPMSTERYTALQRLCDAYISLHRSEGFGLNIAECMQLGKPVIATDYSGNADFLSDNLGYPVPYSLIPVKEGEYPEAEGQVWAEPDVDYAAAALRHVFDNPKDARAKGLAAKAHMQRHYSVERISELVLEHYARIQDTAFAKSVVRGPVPIIEPANAPIEQPISMGKLA
ncbi:MAG: glycosyltransferase family 4 protein [Henriciella sp.]|uniref:glycosyltransferase family 4 protein n=1 Tax=Henriciella sp. TaxID=1968823 RepID=UPI003C733D23